MHLRSHNKQNVTNEPIIHHNTQPINTHLTHNTHNTNPLKNTHGTNKVNTYGAHGYAEPGQVKPSTIGGKKDKIKGKVKESVGRMLNKPELIVSGTQDKLKGDAKVASAKFKRSIV